MCPSLSQNISFHCFCLFLPQATTMKMSDNDEDKLLQSVSKMSMLPFPKPQVGSSSSCSRFHSFSLFLSISNHNYDLFSRNKEPLTLEKKMRVSLSSRKEAKWDPKSFQNGEALPNGNWWSWKRSHFNFIPFFILHFLPFFFLLTYFCHCFRAYGLRLLILCSILSEDLIHIEFYRHHSTSSSFYYFFVLNFFFVL